MESKTSSVLAGFYCFSFEIFRLEEETFSNKCWNFQIILPTLYLLLFTHYSVLIEYGPT